mgnify:CR=1 FL=1
MAILVISTITHFYTVSHMTASRLRARFGEPFDPLRLRARCTHQIEIGHFEMRKEIVWLQHVLSRHQR